MYFKVKMCNIFCFCHLYNMENDFYPIRTKFWDLRIFVEVHLDHLIFDFWEVGVIVQQRKTYVRITITEAKFKLFNFWILPNAPVWMNINVEFVEITCNFLKSALLRLGIQRKLWKWSDILVGFNVGYKNNNK